MLRLISKAYRDLIAALAGYAESVREADRKFRDMHGLGDEDIPPSIATGPLPPAIVAAAGVREEPGREEPQEVAQATRPAEQGDPPVTSPNGKRRGAQKMGRP